MECMLTHSDLLHSIRPLSDVVSTTNYMLPSSSELAVAEEQIVGTSVKHFRDTNKMYWNYTLGRIQKVEVHQSQSCQTSCALCFT
jgi:hypothetical protein